MRQIPLRDSDIQPNGELTPDARRAFFEECGEATYLPNELFPHPPYGGSFKTDKPTPRLSRVTPAGVLKLKGRIYRASTPALQAMRHAAYTDQNIPPQIKDATLRFTEVELRRRGAWTPSQREMRKGFGFNCMLVEDATQLDLLLPLLMNKTVPIYAPYGVRPFSQTLTRITWCPKRPPHTMSGHIALVLDPLLGATLVRLMSGERRTLCVLGWQPLVGCTCKKEMGS